MLLMIGNYSYATDTVTDCQIAMATLVRNMDGSEFLMATHNPIESSSSSSAMV